MTHHLQSRDIIALGFMTFALFVGAGNIIFPPMVGLQAGEHACAAACGFLITAVGLPVLTIIALAKVGGSVDGLSAPIGKIAGILLSAICYITVGPLFAVPRTATVSFTVGIAPLISGNTTLLFLYSLVYFSIVMLISLYPSKLLGTIGNFLAPIKITALIALAIAAIALPAGPLSHALSTYRISAFTNGFVSGYLTMDALGAMVFGIVIINAARSRGIIETRLLTRYTVWAGLMAGVGLIFLYLALFRLGANSSILVKQDANGAEILHAYVQYTFGNIGSFLLSVLIFVACLVTAVGLTCSCAEFFSKCLPLSYGMLVFILSGFSMAISNCGLSSLIQISTLILTAIYPPCIALVILSFFSHRPWWNNTTRVVTPSMIISLFFGIVDGIRSSVFSSILPIWIKHLPLSEQGLIWLTPTALALILATIWDRVAK